jgi:TRAP-type C4-dicarboxylate transport system permease small subunit
VVGRYVFGRTFISADEVQIYIMVYIAFLGAAVATWRRMHLRMDVLVQRLPRGVQAGLGVVEVVLTVLLAGFVLYVASGYVRQMAGLDARSQNAGIPMWIPHSAIVIGFGLIAVLSVLQTIQLFRKGDAP